MENVVCVKRVPDLSEVEIEIDPDGRSLLGEEELDWTINEWDNFAIEEAVRLKEACGGRAVAVTAGGEEDEEVLRRALAMGCDAAVRLDDPAFAGADAHALARILEAAVRRGPCDLVLAGAISADESRAAVPGLLAARLGAAYVALATGIEAADGRLRVRHEVEGGLERVVEVPTPAVVSVQTGINEPRYVSIRGIRRVSGMEIPVLGAVDLGLDPAELGARVVREELFLPPKGEGAEILEGDPEEVVETLLDRIRERGGIAL